MAVRVRTPQPAERDRSGLLGVLLVTALLCPDLGAARNAPLGRGLPGLPTIAVDGVDCSLHDAILAANSGGTVGGCTGSPGLEILSLEADVVLSAPDTTHSTLVAGAFAALPEVTTGIILAAGTASVIERDPSLGCEVSDPASFRLLQVGDGGSLYVDGITLRNGCVSPGSGQPSAGGAIHVGPGRLELRDATLEANTVIGLANSDPGAVGGALACFGGSVPSVEGVVFRDNLVRGVGLSEPASARGGGVYLEDCSVAAWHGGEAEGNSALASSSPAGIARGGGLSFALASVGELDGVLVVDNLARGGDDDSAFFAGRGAGGGIHFSGGTVDRLTSLTFRANRAEGGDASAGDGGSANGGALAMDDGALVAEMRSGLLVGNVATGGDGGGAGQAGGGGGGGIAIESGRLEWLADSWLDANVAISGNAVAETAGSEARGGGIAVGGDLVLMERVTFSYNVAESRVSGSGVTGGGGLWVIGSAGRISQSTFYGNRASGGAGLGPGPGGNAGGGAMLLNTEAVGEIIANTVVGNLAEGGTGVGGSGAGRGGGILTEGSGGRGGDLIAIGNLLAGNRVRTPPGSLAQEDCATFDESPVLDGGWNVVENPGPCSFVGIGDRLGVNGTNHPLGDWGCEVVLPDGRCVPTLPIDQDSPAIDAGNCGAAAISTDARGVLRPFDFKTVADAVLGCDSGAFEATDGDGDGFAEADDCAPEDPSIHATDLCGVCGGDGSGCSIFADGFESGDVTSWSVGR